MKRYERLQLENNNNEEMLVTNVAIKATDLIMAIGAGAFALTGISLFINSRRKGAALKERQDFEARIIAGLIAEGASEAELENARNLLKKMV